jgi:hypothetical protein
MVRKANIGVISQQELPKTTVKRHFDVKKFIRLAKEVKKITDKEKKDGFLIHDYDRNSRYSF